MELAPDADPVIEQAGEPGTKIIGTLIPAKQGGFRLQDPAGYQYSKISTSITRMRTYWACADKKKLGCKATAITNSTNNDIVKIMDHTHLVRLLQRHAVAVEERLIEVAATLPTVAPRTVYGGAAVTLNAEGVGALAYMRKPKSLARAIQRQRIKVNYIRYLLIFIYLLFLIK